MVISEQKVTVDLPSLRLDSEGETEKGIHWEEGWSVEGTMELGLQVSGPASAPHQVMLNVRPLTAHYDVPVGCPEHVRRAVNHLNQRLCARLLGEPLPADDA